MHLPKGLRCFVVRGKLVVTARGDANLGVAHQVFAQSFFAVVAKVYHFQKFIVAIEIRKESKLVHRRSEHAAGLQVDVRQAELALLEADDLVPEPGNLSDEEVPLRHYSLIVAHAPGNLLYVPHGMIELPLQLLISSLQLLDLVSIRISTLQRNPKRWRRRDTNSSRT